MLIIHLESQALSADMPYLSGKRLCLRPAHDPNHSMPGESVIFLYFQRASATQPLLDAWLRNRDRV